MARPFAALLLALIRLYKLALSPALATVGVRCRHWPTCSSYAADAVGLHGAWPGVWMALARVARCRPLGSAGVDPAPMELVPNARWWAPWRYGDWRGPAQSELGPGEQGPSDMGPATKGCEDAEAHVS